MHSIRVGIGFAAVCAAAFGISQAAVAQAVPSSGSTTRSAITHPSVLGQSVDASTLADLSGGTDVTQRVTLNGTVSGNSTQDVSTGYNAIAGGAFSNASGLPMVIQNTGNSVLIQNATTINLQLQQ